MSKYEISPFCRIIPSGDVTFLCNTGYGYIVKIPTECWDTLVNCIPNYSLEEILDATADEEDLAYYRQLLDELIKKSILVTPESFQVNSIDLVITNRCNLACRHCCADAASVMSDDPLSFEEILRIIDELCAINPESIVINGGEPMVRKDFFEISRYLRKHYNGIICLMTNGTCINAGNVDELIPLFDSINISLDGYDEETCSKIRGCGVFAKAIGAIELLIEHGYPSSQIAASMVETNYTNGDSKKFEQLCKDLSINPMIRIFNPIGRGAQNKDEFLITEEKTDIASDDLNSENGPTVIIQHKGLDFTCRACRAGYLKFAISHEGILYPCPLLDAKAFDMGNVREIDSLSRYILKGEYKKTEGFRHFQEIHPKYHSKCNNCVMNPICIYCYADFMQYIDNEAFETMCHEKYNWLKAVIEQERSI